VPWGFLAVQPAILCGSQAFKVTVARDLSSVARACGASAMARQTSSVASRQQIGLPGHGAATTRGCRPHEDAKKPAQGGLWVFA